MSVQSVSMVDQEICPSCQKPVKNNCGIQEMFPCHIDEEEVFMVKCPSCDKCIGLRNDETFLSLQDILYDAGKCGQDGWKQVDGHKDRRILFALNQIIYKEHQPPEESQLEVIFEFPPLTDFIKLCWIDANAVGWYSMKPKGTFDPTSMECYSMVTLDTVFIRKEYRRCGLALSALKDILVDFPDQNVGLSHPVSIPMQKVLAKVLEERPQDRLRFWEITGCGNPDMGNCRNLWLILHKTRSSRGPGAPD